LNCSYGSQSQNYDLQGSPKDLLLGANENGNDDKDNDDDEEAWRSHLFVTCCVLISCSRVAWLRAANMFGIRCYSANRDEKYDC